MPARIYRQFCACSYGLDRVGDRWSLLIIRELVLGPARFGQLHSSLSGIATNLLTNRLREMESDGLVDRLESADGTTTVGYALTDRGRRLEPLLREMVLWGLEFVEDPAPNEVTPPRAWVTAVALLAGEVQLSTGGATLHFSVSDLDSTIAVTGGAAQLTLGAPDNADAHLTTDPTALLGLLEGTRSVADMLPGGDAPSGDGERAFTELFAGMHRQVLARRAPQA